MSSCQTCGKVFGFFNKELGCPKCNLVFCKKCLCHKIQASDNPKKQIYVCLRCASLPLIAKSEKAPLEELLEVKPEEIESPVLEPSCSNDIRNRLDELKNDKLSTEDQNIDDIQKRLADLKGIDYNKTKTTDKIIFSTDNRSEQEKIDDLLKQFLEEKEINEQYTPQQSENQPSAGSVDDIERRLAILRGVDVSKIKSQIDEDFVPETEREEIDRTIQQYLEEAKLPDMDEQEFMDSIPKEGDKKDLKELPFCEICNEDAVLRCMECENLFCHSCFLEFHEEEEYKTHKTKPYQAPNEDD